VDVSIFIDFRARPGVPPTASDYDDGIRLVQAAERCGLYGVWTTEQHGVDDGYLPAQFPMLAALARETETLRLGAGVILLPLTHPRRVLEEACLVDVLSHGRVTLGLGAGNYPSEFRIFGVPMRHRGRLMDEGVRFVRDGLSGGVLPDGLPVNVPPVQRPIPLVLGGLAEPAVDRAARLADGHFAYDFSHPEVFLPSLYADVIGPAMSRHGRTPERFRLIFATVLWASDDFQQEWREIVGPAFLYQQRKYREWEGDVASAGGYTSSRDLDELMPRMLVGTSTQIAKRLTLLHVRYPFHEVLFWARLPGVPLEMALEHVERIGTEVVPALRGADTGRR
jgi:alkanesulfonate monooxygenase SsuD/methylene tetrahydromethanopterin reductase-like flavin-dependent oxidoreductase (luciferase family)